MQRGDGEVIYFDPHGVASARNPRSEARERFAIGRVVMFACSGI